MPLNIALAQINPTVGDFSGNIRLICEAYETAIAQGAELVVFPECCLIGYPAEDLLLVPAFRKQARAALDELAAYTQGKSAAMLVGAPWQETDHPEPTDTLSALYNAACLLEGGEIQQVIRKHDLPNEGVFDEKRVFASAAIPDVVEWRGHRLGILVCRDIWCDEVIRAMALQQPEAFIVINASPFHRRKQAMREEVCHRVIDMHPVPIIYVNQSGGQDELVFDGGSFVMNLQKQLTARLPFFASAVETIALDALAGPVQEMPEETALLYRAACTGLQDYVSKNGFHEVVIGLSGGIDSALTAVMAVDALGAEKVRTVMMRSPYTADISIKDAAELAGRLGVRHDELTIEPGMEAVETMLAPLGKPSQAEIPNALARENIQSRLRGLLLMAVSNSTGALLLTTGNKSELATGYATLYGDMCGAFSVLKDVYKTEVFAMARWRNEHKPAEALGPSGEVMPPRIIIRPPSAELRADQRDEDSLPPYETLDALLKQMIEERVSSEALTAQGHAEETVRHVAMLLRRNEYKRRQAPPGVKLTPLSFGKDWRMPLTNRASL